MKTIKLSKGKEAIVDDDDYEFLIQWKWYYGTNGYARRQTPRPNRKTIPMHRVITNCPQDQQVDHINGNTLDNRKCNLRICTIAENQRNKRKIKPAASKYKGVSKDRHKWKACLEHNNKCIYFGSFNTEKEAALAYNEGAKKYFGEFAKLNIIED